MERSEVYKIIDDERDYQDNERKLMQLDDSTDSEKSPEAFILFIEEKLNCAKTEAYYLGRNGIQDNIRKIAALAVASMEAFGAPNRMREIDETDEFFTEQKD